MPNMAQLSPPKHDMTTPPIPPTPSGLPDSHHTDQLFGIPYSLHFEEESIRDVRLEGNETVARLMELSNARKEREMTTLCLYGSPIGTVFTGLPNRHREAQRNGQRLAAKAIKAMMNELRIAD